MKNRLLHTQALNIVFLLLYSCNNKKPEKDFLLLNYTVDTIVLDLEKNYGSGMWSIAEDINNEVFAEVYQGYGAEHIKLFSMKDNKIIHQIDISDISKLHGEIEGMHYHNRDSIFVFYENAIFRVDINNNKHFVAAINDSAHNNIQGLYLVQARTKNQFYYHKNKLCLPVIWFGNPTDKHSCMAAYDLITKTFNSLPVSFPNNYINNYYGYSHVFNVCAIPDGLLFSFDCNDTLYAFNFITSQVTAFNAKNKKRETDFIPISLPDRGNNNKKMEVFFTAPRYTDVFYDKHRELVYRIFNDKMDSLNMSGKRNTLLNKDKYLSVYTKQLEYIGDIVIPHSRFNFLLGVGKKGIYFVAGDDNSLHEERQKTVYYRVNIDLP